MTPTPGSGKPILAKLLADTGSTILAALDQKREQNEPIAEAWRIEFFPGKRKKNGEWVKTGHIYWQYSYKDEAGRRKRKYGGSIQTLPAGEAYQRRLREYQENTGDLADGLFRSAISRLQSGDTGSE